MPRTVLNCSKKLRHSQKEFIGAKTDSNQAAATQEWLGAPYPQGPWEKPIEIKGKSKVRKLLAALA